LLCSYFATHINETLIEQMADAMVSTGLAKVGFEYINIDAGYLIRERSPNGTIQSNPQLFPSGIRHLADYVHARGLKLGVYVTGQEFLL
jgi:alpha-galactosidase